MKKALLSALILSLAPCLVQALGLGNLKLESTLNEPFRARIELLSATAEEISSAHIGLASDKAFQNAGIPRPYLLNQLRFSIKESETGPDYVMVTSDEPIREPFLNFLLEISWSKGRLYREYTVLLDPPLYVTETARKQVTPPAVSGITKQEPSALVSKPISQEGHTVVYAPEYKPASRTPVIAAQYSGGDYGPVASGETLWSIASAMRPDSSVSIQQMMLALQRANPEAFINNNINGLKRGAVLKVPEQEDIQSLSKAEAFTQAGLQNSFWEEARQALTVAPPPVRPAGEAAPESVPAPAPAESVKEEAAPVTPEVEEKPELRLVVPAEEGKSPGQGGEAAPDEQALAQELALATESLEALTQENTELKDKVAETEAIISDLNRLIALRENELAALQQQVAKKQEAPQSKKEATPAVAEPKAAKAQQPEQKPAPKAKAPAPETGIVATLFAMLGGLIDLVRSNLLYIAGALIAALAVFTGAYVVQRRRQQAAAVAGSEDVTMIAGAEEITDIGMTAESEAITEYPGEKVKSASPPPADVQTAPPPPAATGGVVIEAADPLEEVNVFLAYEHFDQAEEFVKNALEKEPENLAYHTKLLEVYYTANNKKAYEDAARILYDKTKGQGEYWNMAQAMWEVLSPKRALFAKTAAGEVDETETAKAGGGIVNIADESERTASGGLDLDLDTTGGGAAATGDTMQVEAAEEQSDVLDVTAAIDTTDDSEVLDVTAAADLESTGTEQETTAADEGALDFSLNLEEETSEQKGTDLDFSLELPQSTEDTGIGQDKDADDHALDFSLNLAEPDTGKVEEEDAGIDLSIDAGEESGADTSRTGASLLDVTSAAMGEFGEEEGEEISRTGSALLDVTSASSIADTEAAPSATADEEVLDLSAEAGRAEDEGILDISAAESDFDLESAQELLDVTSAGSVADIEASAEGEALDFELSPETDAAPAFNGIDITSDSGSKSKLDLALEPVEESPEEAFEMDMDATMQIPTKRSTLSGSGDEDATLRVPRTSGDAQSDEDEIATQIELARAYIELGNAESAKTILSEVLLAGNAAQQKQAQELLGQIS